MNVVLISGRILFGLPFIIFAGFHFFFANQLAGQIPPYVPGSVLWVYGTGAILLAGGLMIVFNKYARTAGIILGVLMLFFIVTVHIPGLMDETKQQIAIVNLLKDTALCGAAFFMGTVLYNH